MISMFTYSSDEDELCRIRQIAKVNAAMLTNERWNMYFYSVLEEVKRKIKDTPLIDLMCFEVAQRDGVEFVEKMRKIYDSALLMLIADKSMSPMEYIKPSILPTSLIVRPATDEQMEEIMFNLFEVFLDKLQRGGKGSFTVDTREGKTRIPLSQIYYFEARNKKVYVRLLNEEIGFYETMDNLEEELMDSFIRTHRSFLVNKQKIRNVSYANSFVALTDKMNIPLSRSYKPVVRRKVCC